MHYRNVNPPGGSDTGALISVLNFKCLITPLNSYRSRGAYIIYEAHWKTSTLSGKLKKPYELYVKGAVRIKRRGLSNDPIKFEGAGMALSDSKKWKKICNSKNSDYDHVIFEGRSWKMDLLA
jgi:hypothetical protein